MLEVIREMHIRSPMRCHFMLTRKALIKKTDKWSEVKDKYPMAYVWNLKTKDTSGLIYKRNRVTDAENKSTVIRGGINWVISRAYTYYYI